MINNLLQILSFFDVQDTKCFDEDMNKSLEMFDLYVSTFVHGIIF